MPLFQTQAKIDREEINALLLNNWNIVIDELLKASQNHTFRGHNIESGQECAVRVTPKGTHLQRISNQLFLVDYLSQTDLRYLCAPIKTKEGKLVLCEKELIIVVFEWARGKSLRFMEFEWMNSRELVHAWGEFLAKFHAESKIFSAKYPEVAKKIQGWRQIHQGILADIKLAEEDQSVVGDAQHYGLLHGDLNCSNFYYDPPFISVFDTDQVQSGFYLWDLAQSIFTVVMLAEAGLPTSGAAVPQANPQLFQEWIVDSYQKTAGKIDRARLRRMIALKKQFYHRFCVRAAKQGDIPADMEPFIRYVLAWLK